MPDNTTFSERVLTWFDKNGRKDLPWQQDINPYRVWLSEIMLQQTQVTTVIPYYQRFIEELPTVSSLANTDEDHVLHLWTGLGYYSRARNLHKTAKHICNEYQGQFPNQVDLLCELPGIGRSTAGAIASIAFQKPASILDGNVKRVLARHAAISGWPGKSSVLKQLWELSERYTPAYRNADYSQAMMDLGATLCTRSKPECFRCPLNKSCAANKQGNPNDFPGKKPKKVLPIKTTQMLIIQNPLGEVLLEKRPPSGIWGGLWSFPQIGTDIDPHQHCSEIHGTSPRSIKHWQTYRHTFSHFHLDIAPVIVELATDINTVMEADRQLWYNVNQPQSIGLATPIKKLMTMLN